MPNPHNMPDRTRVLMVCMGNICRSPTAEAVLRHKLLERGLHERVEVDSAGTHGWHEGAPPDHRSQARARLRGYDLSAIRSRPVVRDDFERFDLVLAMDGDNLTWLEEACPGEHQGKLARLLEFSPQAPATLDVPDPYYGSGSDFDHVLDLVEQACDGLVQKLGSGAVR
jgi:protein-tyrosine phosphatase